MSESQESTQQPPAEGGGVSPAANVESPAQNEGLEKTDSQGGIVDTVKSYLGMGSGTGPSGSETGQLGTTGDTKNAEDTSGSGSGAGFTGALASAASAAGLSSGNEAAGGGVGTTSSDSATGTEGTSSNSSSALETAKEKVQEVTNTGKKESTSGDDDHKPPQPAGGKPQKLENESAIPTAGGERLGEHHWGESKIVPDNPPPRSSEAGISSEEGKPTQETSDNTAKNTGGASGPPGESSGDNSSGSSGGGDSGEKTKMTDKIKDKLHIGKKE